MISQNSSFTINHKNADCERIARQTHVKLGRVAGIHACRRSAKPLVQTRRCSKVHLFTHCGRNLDLGYVLVQTGADYNIWNPCPARVYVKFFKCELSQSCQYHHWHCNEHSGFWVIRYNYRLFIQTRLFRIGEKTNFLNIRFLKEIISNSWPGLPPI